MSSKRALFSYLWVTIGVGMINLYLTDPVYHFIWSLYYIPAVLFILRCPNYRTVTLVIFVTTMVRYVVGYYIELDLSLYAFVMASLNLLANCILFFIIGYFKIENVRLEAELDQLKEDLNDMKWRN